MIQSRSASTGGSALEPLARIPWHPVVLAAAYVLNAYVAESVSPYAALRALAAAVLLAALLQLLGWSLLRDRRSGALLATATVAFVIFGRDVVLIATNSLRLVPGGLLAVLAVLVAAAVAVTILIAAQSLRRKDGVASWTRGLNAVAAVVMVVVLLRGAASGRIGETVADLTQGVSLADASNRSGADRSGPDIYVILLDGHPRADVLADQFGYDEGPFLAELASRGFEVARASHSNYMLTEPTLVSMFQMALLTDLPELGQLVDLGSGVWEARQLLSDNPVFRFLRGRGYVTVAFQLHTEAVSLRQADVFIDNSQLTEFEGELIAGTFLLDLIQGVAPDLLPSAQRARIDDAFDNLVNVAQDHSLGPRFVFGHVGAPHSPFVFGPNGEHLRVPEQRRKDDTAIGLGLTAAEFAERLAGQTAYVDSRTLETIDAILAASELPPVIIVMSDHGSRSQSIDPATATPDALRERFGTLFAAYTPGRADVFRQDETTAAVLVHLLNAYFEANLVEPAGGTFVSRGGQPFVLTRVAEPPGPN